MFWGKMALDSWQERWKVTRQKEEQLSRDSSMHGEDLVNIKLVYWQKKPRHPEYIMLILK